MLRLHNIGKSFGPVSVLRGINIQLQQGETLGLVGENGAGKSTLMNILGGVFPPTEGFIEINGQPYQPKKVKDSLAKGIAFIHQELNLFPNLSVAENIFIDQFPVTRSPLGWLFDRQKLHQQALELISDIGLTVPPGQMVGVLPNGQQQLVEIAKALKGQPQLVIFDEPTTALSQQETDHLLELIGTLKKKGISMIYISHNLEEVLAVSDKIAVLRDGNLIEQRAASDYSRKEMIRDMVGRDLEQYFPVRSGSPSNEVALNVRELSVDQTNKISFQLHQGEILGFYGLVGAGRSEMARGLYGLQKVYGGEITWEGKRINSFSPKSWISNGVAYLTEDRRDEGLLSFKSIRENVQLAALPKFASRWTASLDYESIKARVMEKITATNVKYQNVEKQEVISLSGGNQQKVLLSRWLMTDPRLIIMDEPTKGIDIGAREEIYHLINQLVIGGAAVILISSEIEELLGMSDRIMVMNHGRITAEFGKHQFNRSDILKHALQA